MERAAKIVAAENAARVLAARAIYRLDPPNPLSPRRALPPNPLSPRRALPPPNAPSTLENLVKEALEEPPLSPLLPNPTQPASLLGKKKRDGSFSQTENTGETHVALSLQAGTQGTGAGDSARPAGKRIKAIAGPRQVGPSVFALMVALFKTIRDPAEWKRPLHPQNSDPESYTMNLNSLTISPKLETPISQH